MRRLLGGACALLGACAPVPGRNAADSLPRLITDGIPFRYPLPLYERRVEGDVTLRLHVDSTGVVVPDSVRVERSSGISELDTAAIQGATVLQFRPATLGGRPVPLTVLFPVRFRMPEARTPSDTGKAQGR